MMDKFIQIMPAVNLYAEYYDNELKHFFYEKILCLALDTESEIHFLGFDDSGGYDDAYCDSFKRFVYSTINIHLKSSEKPLNVNFEENKENDILKHEIHKIIEINNKLNEQKLRILSENNANLEVIK